MVVITVSIFLQPSDDFDDFSCTVLHDCFALFLRLSDASLKIYSFKFIKKLGDLAKASHEGPRFSVVMVPLVGIL